MRRPDLIEPHKQAAGVVAEFFTGFATLFRGFTWWKRRPGLMLLGLVPALIVAVALVALVLVIATNAEGIVAFLTPFAESWDPALRRVFRVALALALLIGFVVLAAFGYTALTLLIGDWFYEKIWRAVEEDLGDFVPGHEPGFWRTVGDSIRLVLRALVTAILLAILGLIPLVGTVIAAVLGLFFSGRIIALELTARPLEARGMARRERLAVLRTRSARVVGFGVAVHLCFLVPGGAILVMAPAVAGATHLARHVLAAVERAPLPSAAAPN
jgi:CysZ protein